MRIVVTASCILFLIGCASNGSGITPRQEHRDFFALSADSQRQKFNQYDMQTRYELVIIGNQLVHPPEIFLTQEFATQGASIVPFLSTKLAEAPNEATVRDIVAMFVQLQRSRLYSVVSDGDLMRLIERRTEAMQGQWKNITGEMLQEIKEGKSNK